MKIVDLSQILENGMPVFPGDPKVKIEEIHTLEKEGWRLKYLQLSSHIGTHADAPYHMDKNGDSLDNLPIDRFIGETMLVSIDDEFSTAVGLAFSEGIIDEKVVERLKAAKPKFVVVGSDATLDIEPERQLLRAEIITITDLVNMDRLPKNKPFMFYGVPLKIKDGDWFTDKSLRRIGLADGQKSPRRVRNKNIQKGI